MNRILFLALVVLAWLNGCGNSEPRSQSHSTPAEDAAANARSIREIQSSAASNPEFALSRRSGVWSSRNAPHHLTAQFFPTEVNLAYFGSSAELQLVGYGRGQPTRSSGATVPHRVANHRIEYERDGFVEWYENGPLGLEQGFSVERRFAGAGDVVFDVEFRGFVPRREANGEIALYRDGQPVLSYRDVFAIDARGTLQPTRTELFGTTVRLRVDDRNAHYPLIVDPIIASFQQVIQIPPGGGAFARQLGMDNDHLVVSAFVAGTNWNGSFLGQQAGVIYRYEYDTDAIQYDFLDTNFGATDERLGESVALWGDNFVAGNWAQGFAFVRTFEWLGTSWRELSPVSSLGGDFSFGQPQALALAGDVLVVGAPSDDRDVTNGGRAFIFEKISQPPGLPRWENARTIQGSVNGGALGQRTAASLEQVFVENDDPDGEERLGVYERSGEQWIRVNGVAGPPPGDDQLAERIEAQGHTVVWGARLANDEAGALYIYQYDGNTWQQQFLVPNDSAGGINFGTYSSLSGNLLAVTADSAVYVFRRTGSTWSQEAKLTEEDSEVNGSFGANVALDGLNLVVTAVDGLEGEAHLFTLDTDGANGSPCHTGDDCTSGACVDHVCCNRECAACESCKAVEKASGVDGFCGPVRAGLDPNNDCADEGASSCGQNGKCDGAGSCALYAGGVDCGNSCDGFEVVGRECNGSGSCVGVSILDNCEPDACIDGACAACMESSECPEGSYCSFGECVVTLDDGQLCDEDAACSSGFCVDDVCCDAACDGGCETCAGFLSLAGNDGECSPVRAGLDPRSNCPDEGAESCGLDGACDGAGACRLYVAGSVCGSFCEDEVTVVHQECDGAGSCETANSQTACLPSVCTNGACTNCNLDEDCPPSMLCDEGSCVDPGANGSPCTDPAECDTGFCVEGVCCDVACDGQCTSCTAQGKTEGPDGVCGLARAGSDPQNDCTDLGALACSTNGLCDGSGSCQLYPAGTPCGLTECIGNTVSGEICDGSGSCIADDASNDCAPYACENGACLGSCLGHEDCTGANVCVEGQCRSPLSQGELCSDNEQCTSGFCVDEVCCESECTGGCESCLAVDREQGADGECGPVALGEDPRDACSEEGASSCGTTGVCDGVGSCERYPQTCGGGGMAGSPNTGGSGNSGGAINTGGTGNSGGAINTGGTGNSGGAIGMGGAGNTAGSGGSGGNENQGGNVNTGGREPTGGSAGSGGSLAQAGADNAGGDQNGGDAGTSNRGGMANLGGESNQGEAGAGGTNQAGTSGRGGNGGRPANPVAPQPSSSSEPSVSATGSPSVGGTAGRGGEETPSGGSEAFDEPGQDAGAADNPNASGDGCGCRVGSSQDSGNHWGWWLLLGIAGAFARRRRGFGLAGFLASFVAACGGGENQRTAPSGTSEVTADAGPTSSDGTESDSNPDDSASSSATTRDSGPIGTAGQGNRPPNVGGSSGAAPDSTSDAAGGSAGSGGNGTLEQGGSGGIGGVGELGGNGGMAGVGGMVISAGGQAGITNGEGGAAGMGGSISLGGSSGEGGATNQGGAAGQAGGSSGQAGAFTGMGGDGGNGGVGGSSGGVGGLASGGSAGQAGSEGGGGAAGSEGGAGGVGDPEMCGDGQVTGQETCDVAIDAGEPGACPAACPYDDWCEPETLEGFGCQRACLVTPITEVEDEPDFCCAEDHDLDCTADYPVRRSGESGGTNGGACGVVDDWQRSLVEIYMPLRETCGVPVHLIVRGSSPGSGEEDNAATSISVESPTSTWPGAGQSLSVESGPIRQASYLIDMSSQEPAFVFGEYHDAKCGGIALQTNATFEASPFVGVRAVRDESPQDVIVGGDHLVHYLAYLDAPAGGERSVRVRSGEYLPERLLCSSGCTTQESSWTDYGDVTVSTMGIDAEHFDMVVEPVAPTDVDDEPGYAHLVWSEGSGTRLRYARVDVDGNLSNARTLAVGTGIEKPALALFHSSEVGVVWLQEVAGLGVVHFARLVLESGELSAPIAQASPETADASEVTFTSAFSSQLRAAVTWQDDSSGVDAVYRRGVLEDGSFEPVEQLDAISFSVRQLRSVATSSGIVTTFSDTSEDSRAWVYTENETLVQASPDPIDAEHLRLATPSSSFSALNGLSHWPSVTQTQLGVWREGPTGEARLAPFGSGHTLLTGTHSIPLSCQPTSMVSLAAVPRHDPSPVNTGIRLVAWVEGGDVRVAGVGARLVPRSSP